MICSNAASLLLHSLPDFGASPRRRVRRRWLTANPRSASLPSCAPRSPPPLLRGMVELLGLRLMPSAAAAAAMQGRGARRPKAGRKERDLEDAAISSSAALPIPSTAGSHPSPSPPPLGQISWALSRPCGAVGQGRSMAARSEQRPGSSISSTAKSGAGQDQHRNAQTGRANSRYVQVPV